MSDIDAHKFKTLISIRIIGDFERILKLYLRLVKLFA